MEFLMNYEQYWRKPGSVRSVTQNVVLVHKFSNTRNNCELFTQYLYPNEAIKTTNKLYSIPY